MGVKGLACMSDVCIFCFQARALRAKGRPHRPNSRNCARKLAPRRPNSRNCARKLCQQGARTAPEPAQPKIHGTFMELSWWNGWGVMPMILERNAKQPMENNVFPKNHGPNPTFMDPTFMELSWNFHGALLAAFGAALADFGRHFVDLVARSGCVC